MERIEYEVIRSARKTIAVQVNIDKSVLVRAPKRCSKAAIEDFVEEHKEWIIRKKKEKTCPSGVRRITGAAVWRQRKRLGKGRLFLQKLWG